MKTDAGMIVAFFLIIVMVCGGARLLDAPAWAAFLGSQVVGYLWLISGRLNK